MKWYKHDPNAFNEGVAGLTTEQVGAYIQILNAIYSRDGHLADDDRLLSHILRRDIRATRRLKSELVTAGKIWVHEGHLTGHRVDFTLEDARKYSRSQAEVAKHRWENVNKIKASLMPREAMPPQPHPYRKKEGGRKGPGWAPRGYSNGRSLGNGQASSIEETLKK
jgi:uncharacterized protein YdaU (DUF1376 family)